MESNELQQSLEALHTEVERLQPGDDATKAKILALIEDLERQIDNPEDSEHASGVLERTQNLIGQFEVEHPRITDTLNRIMMALSDMGI